MSALNSENGIKVVVEKANSNPPMLNLVRPAVVRQYFGLQLPQSNIRCTYPLMTSLGNVRNGTDTHNFVTRPMGPTMTAISNRLHQVLLKNREELNLQTVDLEDPFNHCTILTYYANEEKERKSSMGFHSDCIYKTKDGSFDYVRNSQQVNTPTVVLSLGDTRTLKWKRRYLLPKLQDEQGSKGSNVNVWQEDSSWDADFELNHNSVTVINPGDENPRSKKNELKRSQYMHGGVSVTGDKLSYGLVFRKVIGRALFDESTHRMVVESDTIHTDYTHLHDKFDGSAFHSALSSKYLNRFY